MFLVMPLVLPADMPDCPKTASLMYIGVGTQLCLTADRRLAAGVSSHHMCLAGSKLSIVAEKVSMTRFDRGHSEKSLVLFQTLEQATRRCRQRRFSDLTGKFYVLQWCPALIHPAGDLLLLPLANFRFLCTEGNGACQQTRAWLSASGASNSSSRRIGHRCCWQVHARSHFCMCNV